jgi:phosphomannomutase
VVEYLKDAGIAGRGLIVGYDTRFASEHFADAVAEVVAASGIKVYLCPGATPTPVVSWGVLAMGAAGAVIITASHNPAIWNGFKFKSHLGTSASPEIIATLEEHISGISSHGSVGRISLSEGLERGLVEYLDLAPIYLGHVSETVDLGGIRRAGLKVVVDPMYGAGAGYFKELLSGGDTRVVEINGEQNPAFPGIRQPEPVAANLAKLSAAVRRRRADVGLATDGDADRIGIVDERGSFLTPLDVFPLLAFYLLEVCGRRGAIIKTITTTSMLYRLGELYGVPVYETPVGFKYVAPKMIEENALIGGEESGGYGFRGHAPERDGILAGIYFLDLMVRLGRSPSELLDRLFSLVGPHCYRRMDLEFPAPEREAITARLASAGPEKICGVGVVRVDTGDGFRFMLGDGSWLLVRFSGTEPVLRIYAESSSLVGAEQLLSEGKRMGGIW